MITRLAFLFSIAAASWASTGQIRVNVSNAPGEITLDGMPTDQTAPAIIDAVSPGQHVVELQYGCLKGRDEVLVREGKTVNANLRMRNVGGEGTVRLRGLPPMAKIYVDDEPVRSVSEGIVMSCGGHRVRAEAEGFADWEEMVAVTSDRWTTVRVYMVEVEIEDEPRRARSLELSIDDSFEEEDDLDFIEDENLDFREEDLIARERALEEREARLLQREKEHQEASRQARNEEARLREARRIQREEDERKSRFGDVDSLDEDNDDPSASRADAVDDAEIDDAAAEALDELELEEGYQRLDVPQENLGRAKRTRSQASNAPFLAGISTAAAGLSGLIYGLVLHGQYTDHRDEWDLIGQETGSPASNEANEFGQNVLNPAKRKRDAVLGISTALLLGGGGFGAYVFFQPSDSSPNRGAQDRIDREIDDLDRLVPAGHFGLNILVKW